MREIREKINKICVKNQLGDLLSFEGVKEGVLNENHEFTTTKGKFFLKDYLKKSVSQMKYIHSIEEFMKKSDLPAVTATLVSEEDHYMIYPFVESDREHSYNMDDYYRMGQMLGRIHNVSFNKEIPQNFKQFSHTEKDTNHILEKIKEYKKLIENKEAKDDIDHLFLTYIEKKLALADDFMNMDALANNTIIHGDYHAGNLMINQDSREIIGVCDWEKAEYAPREYEIARSYLYTGFGTDVDDPALCKEISESFLQGYRSIIPLSDEDFEKGIRIRLKSYVFNYWMEDKFYTDKDPRANKFINNVIRVLDSFCTNKIV